MHRAAPMLLGVNWQKSDRRLRYLFRGHHFINYLDMMTLMFIMNNYQYRYAWRLLVNAAAVPASTISLEKRL
jgi:hypothetical protein